MTGAKRRYRSVVEFQGVQIVARGVSVRGPRGCAVANVSVDVPAGRLAVVVGPAGSGRTSLLLALAGRMRLVTGTVAVGSCRLPGDADRVRRLVALAAAAPALDLDEFLTAGEHVSERFLTSRSGATPDTVSAAMDLVGCNAPRPVRIGELRPDDRVLLAVALAAAERPGAVVVDDADRGCRPDESRRVWDGLRALAERGCTVVASGTQIPEGLDPVDTVVARLPHPIDRDRIPVPDGEAQ